MTVNGSKTTKLTKAAGLEFNINDVSRDMGKWFKLQEGKNPIYKKSHIAMTCALQSMIKYIITEAFNLTRENRYGCNEITKGTLIVTITSNKELKEYYGYKVGNEFNKGQRYESSVPILLKEMKRYVTSINENIKVHENAYNLMYYMLSVFYNDILISSNVIMKLGSAKSFSSITVTTALQILLRNCPRITKSMLKDINTSIDLITDEKVTEAEDEAGDEDAGDEDADEEAEQVVAETSKGTSRKVSEAKTKAKAVVASASTAKPKDTKKKPETTKKPETKKPETKKAETKKDEVRKGSKTKILSPEDDGDEDSLINDDEDIIDAPVKKPAAKTVNKKTK